MTARRFELLVFDWDGTVVDSAAHIVASIQAACADLELTVPRAEQARYIIGLGMQDAMQHLLKDQDFFASPFEGRMFDCGSREGFIQANVAFALARDDIRDLVFEPIGEMVAMQAKRRRAA